ncbi:MAG TPA: thioredoxin family protein [Ktedonobacterales bacterium]
MRLVIYTASHCLGCDYTLEIAEDARRIAGLETVVIVLEQAREAVPDNVVAVPTYVLDGRVVALGNPNREEFLRALRAQVKERTP